MIIRIYFNQISVKDKKNTYLIQSMISENKQKFCKMEGINVRHTCDTLVKIHIKALTILLKVEHFSFIHNPEIYLYARCKR